MQILLSKYKNTMGWTIQNCLCHRDINFCVSCYSSSNNTEHMKLSTRGLNTSQWKWYMRCLNHSFQNQLLSYTQFCHCHMHCYQDFVLWSYQYNSVYSNSVFSSRSKLICHLASCAPTLHYLLIDGIVHKPYESFVTLILGLWDLSSFLKLLSIFLHPCLLIWCNYSVTFH